MRIIALAALFCALLAPPSAALAQQRSLGLVVDGGWDIIAAPTVPAHAPNISALPLRLRDGWRLGLESNHKIQHDQWRVFLRGNVHFLKFPRGAPANSFDHLANAQLGTVVGFQGESGARYYFWTDKFRPYAELGISYLYLKHFSSGGRAPCGSGPYCNLPGASSAEAVYLPHQSIVALHVQPGFEYSLRRDMAIKAGVDIQRWIVFNASDSTMFTLALGFVFYS